MSIWTELWERVTEIANDIGIISKKVNTVALAAVADGTSIYRTDRDANGIFVTTTWKRTDGTNAKISQLSMLDGSNRYTRRTETFYDTNGTTVLIVRVYTLTYNAFDQVTSEVLA